jgi:23S rRNA pseudouridine1911/1915/1917 synthase
LSKETPERLDKFLVGLLQEFSRSRIQGLIADGFVDVDGRAARKSGQPLENGSTVTVRIPPAVPTELVAEDIPLDIVFENDDLIVVDKPAGMVVHPAAGHASGTLVNAVLGYDPDLEGIGGEERPGVVHRLDKATSGLILLAKNERAHRWLQEQFRLRKVEKTYLALVDGKAADTFRAASRRISGATQSKERKWQLSPRVKGAKRSRSIKPSKSSINIPCWNSIPHTGRTHQIRLHCAFLKCPIVGDEVYGRKNPTIEIGRHFLHAHRLRIVLPNEEEPRLFEAPLPEELENVLNFLRKGK